MMKRCKSTNQEAVYRWLKTHHDNAVEQLLLRHSKDEAAKLLREHYHEHGVTRTDTGVFLSRNQIRQGLVPFRRLPIAEREAELERQRRALAEHMQDGI